MQLNHWPYFPVCLFFCWFFFSSSPLSLPVLFFTGVVAPVALSAHARGSSLPLQTFSKPRKCGRWRRSPPHAPCQGPLTQSQVTFLYYMLMQHIDCLCYTNISVILHRAVCFERVEPKSPPTGFSLVDLIMCCSSSCIQQLTTHTT